MHARVVTSHIAVDKIDQAIELFRDSVLASAKQQQGFNSGRLLVDHSSGKFVSIGLWETAADIEASGEQSEFYQDQIAKFAALFTEPPVAEQFEVAVEG